MYSGFPEKVQQISLSKGITVEKIKVFILAKNTVGFSVCCDNNWADNRKTFFCALHQYFVIVYQKNVLLNIHSAYKVLLKHFNSVHFSNTLFFIIMQNNLPVTTSNLPPPLAKHQNIYLLNLAFWINPIVYPWCRRLCAHKKDDFQCVCCFESRLFW